MKPTLLSSLLIFILLAACTNNTQQQNPPPEIPKALEEKGSYLLITKRGGNNVLEDLYNELVEKTPELKNLENQIDHLNSSRIDFAEIFNNYNSKYTMYYSEANQAMGLVKDSAIKEKIKELIASSKKKYDAKVEEHTQLLDAIDAKFLSLNDLHTFLKIKRTMPIIEKYQSDHLPSIKPIDAYGQQVDATLKLIDSLVNK